MMAPATGTTAARAKFLRPDTLTEKLLVSFKWFLIVLVLLVLGWAALAATKWLPQTSDVQRRSLAILDQPPRTAVGHRNAFAAIWLWRYDIPAADLEAVASADLERYRRSLADPRDPFVSKAEGNYRSQDMSGSFLQDLCSAVDADCLAKVRMHTNTTRRYLEAHALLLEHARALEGYDYYHDRFPPHPGNPFPQIGAMGMLLLGDAALHFVDGDRAEGLQRACQAALTWRNLALHADSRAVQSVAGRYYVGASGLVAGMRAELPFDAPLPPTCGQSFAAIGDEDSGSCDLMKVDFASNAAALRRIGEPLDKRPGAGNESRWAQMLGRLLTNGNAAVAYSAPPYASYCTHDADIQHEALRLDAAASWTSCGIGQALFDPVGCNLANTLNPRLRSSPSQFQDMQRMNVLVRATLARDTAKAAARPSGSASDGELPAGVSLDAKEHELRIARAFSLEGEDRDFAIPLPGSRLR